MRRWTVCGRRNSWKQPRFGIPRYTNARNGRLRSDPPSRPAKNAGYGLRHTYDCYAVRAFDANAIDYLLKPVGQARFERALARAKERIAESSKEDVAERIVATLEQIKRQDKYFDRLPVSENGRILFVKTKEIDWIEANGNYVRVHVGTRTHEIRETLNTLERKLDPRDFLRIHRSTIVNVHLIKEIQPWFHGYHLVLLQNGQELRMSRYQNEIAKRLGLA